MFHSQSLLFVPYTNPAPVFRADPVKMTNPRKEANRSDHKGRNHAWQLSYRFCVSYSKQLPLTQLFRAYMNTPDRIAYKGFLFPFDYYIIYNHICTHKVNRKFTSMLGFVEIARFFGTFYSWISYIPFGLAYRVTG